MQSSQYIQTERKDYALYILQSRAIPLLADGLKSSARRVLWTAKDGKKYKTATLAGATMPIHPHASPEGTINTLAAPYGNNIPLLHGEGAFGTLLRPDAFGAARYTSVSPSQFTKDVVYRDIEIVPLQENYDGTLQEPIHFLPLIPVVLLNPQEGIAVGFATNILPRSLKDIIHSQIKHLCGENVTDIKPSFVPTSSYSEGLDNEKWKFTGSYEQLNATTIRITNLPYGVTHEKYIERLTKMEDAGLIQEFEDSSKDKYNIIIRFKKGVLNNTPKSKLVSLLGLTSTVSENLTIIDLDGQHVITPTYPDIIRKFTDWRLQWYKVRYERLAKLLAIDIERYNDVLRAIEKNVGGIARKTGSRDELNVFLNEIGIVHTDYIADLPVYRFTEQEKMNTGNKLVQALTLMKTYQHLLNSNNERVKVYINELKAILTKF